MRFPGKRTAGARAHGLLEWLDSGEEDRRHKAAGERKALTMIDKKRPDWNTSLQEMFDSISKRYDLLNSLMSFGQDRRWRKSFLELADVPERGSLLDVGAGTGEIALDAKRLHPGLKVTALDLTAGMMQVGRGKPSGGDVLWVQGDALNFLSPTRASTS